MISQEQIRDFWNWFSSNAQHFGKFLQNEMLLADLDRRVANLGDFAWEVGPGEVAENAFVLSPGGNRELLPITQTIVAAAPTLAGWEFHSAKPPKQWKAIFELEDENGSPFQVDATHWRCVLLRYGDGTHEVVVEALNLSALSEEYRRWAVEIMLDGLLGERCRLEAIDEVTVVLELKGKENDAAFPILNLSERLN